jgi:hypothetical protein
MRVIVVGLLLVVAMYLGVGYFFVPSPKVPPVQQKWQVLVLFKNDVKALEAKSETFEVYQSGMETCVLFKDNGKPTSLACGVIAVGRE